MSYDFDIYFGSPGSGKTTFAAYLASQALKKGIPVYSNVPIKGCFEIKKSDIGYVHLENALLIWDEAGIDFDNRNFKSNFTYEQVRWFKLYRHYKMQIAIFSQSFEDMDKKLRVLSNHQYLVKHIPLLPYFPFRRTINKYIGINEDTKQVQDSYEFVPFSRKFILGFRYWKMFDSYSAPHLETKVLRKYSDV